MKVLSLVSTFLLLSLTLIAPVVSANNFQTETFTSNFRADKSLTDKGNGYVSESATVEVFNMTGDMEEVPLNILTWPETNGTYSGAVFQESILALDYVGVDKQTSTPYSYVTLGSIHNWSSMDIMNGAVKTNVRLPWYGDHYEFMSMRIYEVPANSGMSLTTTATPNGTVPITTNIEAVKIYENYLNFDMWEWDSSILDITLNDYFYFPDELHTWPFRFDPVAGYYTQNEVGWGPNPYATFREGTSYSMEMIDNRYYSDLNLFIKPDQNYLFTTSAIIKSNEKPEIAISSESINGGNRSSTIIQGILDENIRKYEQTDVLSEVELGWSFLFQGGHGDGITGFEVEGEYNQSIEFMIEMDDAITSDENLTIMLPIIPDNENSFDYSIKILAFNESGGEVEWLAHGETVNLHADGNLFDTLFEGLDNSLESEGFILYSPRCESESNPGSIVPCRPVGAVDYYVKIFLNYNTEDPLTNFRLIGTEGNKGFLVSNNDLTDIALCSTGDQCLAQRIGGDYYGYNLSYSAQYHEGSWVQVDNEGVVITYTRLENKFTGKQVGFSSIEKVVGLTTPSSSSGSNEEEVDLFAEAAEAWENFDVSDPSTYGAIADAIMFALAGVLTQLWEGTLAIYGGIQTAFSNTKDYLLELGHFTEVYLGEILDAVVSMVVMIYDYLVPIAQYMIALAGAWVFYFGLRLILLVASYVHISLRGGAFR